MKTPEPVILRAGMHVTYDGVDGCRHYATIESIDHAARTVTIARGYYGVSTHALADWTTPDVREHGTGAPIATPADPARFEQLAARIRSRAASAQQQTQGA